ncbi:putative membrane protein [Sphingomonas kyeonggiensis]|uniref:hypothetical protein n=1 Tax=Sphingomonas kyeonggiensis TaxID=1268553 RepID=UPI002785ED60|nr:hypothetical protein [Sphingomonas kyeonggiensis]MDQ0251058.1 putative membrane protein [Sphingomonas kyeonggiensis]
MTAGAGVSERSSMLLGWAILALLVLALFPLQRIVGFGNFGVVLLYAFLFAIGTRLSLAGPRFRIARVGWAVLFSVMLPVVATLVGFLGAEASDLQEVGPVGAFLIFGFYLGLPCLFFAVLMAFVPNMIEMQ